MECLDLIERLEWKIDYLDVISFNITKINHKCQKARELRHPINAMVTHFMQNQIYILVLSDVWLIYDVKHECLYATMDLRRTLQARESWIGRNQCLNSIYDRLQIDLY